MGLDTVETVMEIEEEFDLAIPDNDAQEIETIGDLYRYVLGRLGINYEPGATPLTPAVPGEPCPNVVVFHRLRRSLMDVCGITRRAVKPSTELTDLLPISRREDDWLRLEQSLGVRLPLLPPAVVHERALVLCLGLLAVACATAYVAHLSGWTFIKLASLLTIPLPLAYLSSRTTAASEAPDLPEDFKTVGMAVHTLVGIRPTLVDRKRIRADDHTAHSVWRRVCEIISETLDVRIEQLTEETHFIRDLDA